MGEAAERGSLLVSGAGVMSSYPPAHGSAGTCGRPGPFREVDRRAVKTQGLRAACTGVSAASVLTRAADTSRSRRPERPAPWGEATAQGCLRAKDSTWLTPAASWAVSCSREARVDDVQDPRGLAWSQRPGALASVVGVPGKKKGRFGVRQVPHTLFGGLPGCMQMPTIPSKLSLNRVHATVCDLTW